MRLSKYFLGPFLLILCSTIAWGQPGDPAGDPDVVPITGLEYLLIAGGALGGYKLFKNRNKEQDQESNNR